MMTISDRGQFVSAVFITFSGNCRQALTYYQTCFGGILQFETFDRELQGYTEIPIISGSLVSDSILIYGSDLIHDEGRILGNYMSIFLHCKNMDDRLVLIQKLERNKKDFLDESYRERLVEVTDVFDVRWVLGA